MPNTEKSNVSKREAFIFFYIQPKLHSSARFPNSGSSLKSWMCRRRFRSSVGNILTRSVSQHLAPAFCTAKQNTLFTCHCQLRGSRTSENCYEWWGFVSGPIQRYQSVFSQGCNAIQSHSKLQQCFYGLVSVGVFCLLGLVWVCFFGVLLCFVFSQSNHLSCVPINPLSGEPLKRFLSVFYVFWLV